MIDTLIVAALLNGNDAVGVADIVNDLARLRVTPRRSQNHDRVPVREPTKGSAGNSPFGPAAPRCFLQHTLVHRCWGPAPDTHSHYSAGRAGQRRTCSDRDSSA